MQNMRGLSGALDHHENARHMLAADTAVTAHTRRTHFASVVTEPVEEATEQAVKKGFRGWFKQLIKGKTVDATTNITRQAIVSTTIIAGGIWFMTGTANIALGWLGNTSEEVDEFAEKNPLAAGAIGIGMLLGVTALGIVIYGRISGSSEKE